MPSRCEDCCRALGTFGQPEYKVPAWICETLQSQRLGGTLDPVSDRTKDWILCRDCCGEILLGVKPVYVPFVDPFKFGPDGN